MAACHRWRRRAKVRNNLLFGKVFCRYDGKVCGRIGAGPGFAGISAVQTSMSNTRMTDFSLLDLRHSACLDAAAIGNGRGLRAAG